MVWEYECWRKGGELYLQKAEEAPHNYGNVYNCRVMEGNQSIGAKEAKAFYDKLWKCLIDARTADRKNRMKSKIDPNKKLKVQKH